ncbi:hypothetical protein JCM8547_008594 [Rhodosporidiobolus lusitaniae]
MLPSAALAGLLLAATQATAFKGTYPVVAWSSERLASLDALAPSAPSASSNARSSPNQQTFSSSSGTDNDLCSLSTLVVLSAPGLHYSDLALLPSSASSPAGIKAALAHFSSSESQGSADTHPYVSKRTKNRAAQLVKRFVRECGAMVEQENVKQLWAGGQGAKTVQIVELNGLDEFELVGHAAREGRKELMQEFDTVASEIVSGLPAPFAVVLTSLPSSFSASSLPVKRAAAPASKLSKRQEMSEDAEAEYVEELLDEIAKEDALDNMIEEMEEFKEEQAKVAAEQDDSAPVVSEDYAADSVDLGVTNVGVEEAVDENPASVSELAAEESYAYEASADESYVSGWDGESLVEVSPYQQDGKNGTSIFEPKPNSGLFHRYVFFTPAIIFSFLVTLLVLVPTLLIGTQALLSIETVQGLETKMAGTVGLDASKA